MFYSPESRPSPAVAPSEVVPPILGAHLQVKRNLQ